jgi:nucleoside-diphosphate-sugar epimerase
VLGPIVHYLNSLDKLNTSNQRIRDVYTGAYKEKLPPTGVVLWTDVRDLALAHVLAAEKQEAQGKRFFVVTGHFSNAEIARIVEKNFPDLKDKLPQGDARKGGELPDASQLPQYDNSRVKEVLGLKFRDLETSITDTVKSLQAVDK